LRNFQHVLASIRRPQDITPQKFHDLNLEVATDIPVSDIVRHDGAKTAPTLPWETNLETPSLGQAPPADGTPVTMDNENPYPPKDKYDLLEQELLLDNDDAFREVARLPPREGRSRVRVTQARKFWTALERMSQYWDDSADNYFERPKSPEPEETKPDATPMDVDTPATAEEQPGAPPAEPELVKKYTGRRLAAGSDMPDDIREETVRALTEMAAWPFGCQASLPIVPPRLLLGKLLFPVRQTFQATRSPKDRQLARNGMLEGPVFIAQCRPDTSFRGPEEAHGAGLGDTCDLIREVAAMILAAQERAREGMTEVRPGEGQWWTTTPRWGGAPNDSIGDSPRVTNEQEKEAAEAAAAGGHERKRSRGGLRRPGLPRKMSSSEKWRLVQPGSSLWDRRMRYIQIGKDKDSPFDDVGATAFPPPSISLVHIYFSKAALTIPDLPPLLNQPPPLHPPPPYPPALPRSSDNGNQRRTWRLTSRTALARSESPPDAMVRPL
jgi:hypothetical protein